MNTSAAYDYQKYSCKNPFVRLAVCHFLKSLAGLIKEVSPGDILDVGCGHGFVIRYIRNYYNNIIIKGIDCNREALLMAKAINPDQQFIQASIYEMPFRDKAFDLLICLEVLEHLVLVDAALAELKRVARRNCLLSVPYEPYFSICRLLGGKNILRLGRHPEHINYFKITAIKEKLKNYFELRKTVIYFPWIIFWGTVK